MESGGTRFCITNIHGHGSAWTGRDWIVKDSILDITVVQDPAGPRIQWHLKIEYKMHLKSRANKIFLG